MSRCSALPLCVFAFGTVVSFLVALRLRAWSSLLTDPLASHSSSAQFGQVATPLEGKPAATEPVTAEPHRNNAEAITAFPPSTSQKAVVAHREEDNRASIPSTSAVSSTDAQQTSTATRTTTLATLLAPSELLALAASQADPNEVPSAREGAGWRLLPANSTGRLFSVAYLVMGLGPDERPIWAAVEDAIMTYRPPAICPCSRPKVREAGRYKHAPMGWWCAQRFYMKAVEEFLQVFPNKLYYFLADADTVVFPQSIYSMMWLLERQVLSPSEDLYMGHAIDPTQGQFGRVAEIGKFIMSGGGVLLRGLTMHKLADSGNLSLCASRALNGSWCWQHLDWVIAECLRRINVIAKGHEAFQQNGGSGNCRPPKIGCHSVKDQADQVRLIQEHKGFDVSRLPADWAAPCEDTAYLWISIGFSVCRWRGRLSVAFLVLGLEPGSRPRWSAVTDAVLTFQPPANCSECPTMPPSRNEQGGHPGSSVKGAQHSAFWCAQRFYFYALQELLRKYPDKDYYFTADADTVVFPLTLHTMTWFLDRTILQAGEDLYMGHSHVNDGSRSRFVLTAGGVLLRGQTLRNLALKGALSECAREHSIGMTCWWQRDWALAACLRRIGVQPRGHEAFQQNLVACPRRCCQWPVVACHPMQDLDQQERVVEAFSSKSHAELHPDWAKPCKDTEYSWNNDRRSICNRKDASRRRSTNKFFGLPTTSSRPGATKSAQAVERAKAGKATTKTESASSPRRRHRRRQPQSRSRGR